MGFLGRIGDSWKVLTGVVEIKYDGTISEDGKLGVVLVDGAGVDYQYDISTISGDLHEWIRNNITPADTYYELDGEIVKTRGNLPLKEIK